MKYTSSNFSCKPQTYCKLFTIEQKLFPLSGQKNQLQRKVVIYLSRLPLHSCNRYYKHFNNLYSRMRDIFVSKQRKMKRKVWLLLILFILTCFTVLQTEAQCSICTKTAQQLGEKPGKGLNVGILYLMLTPLTIAGFIGLKWWNREKTIKE